MSGKRFKLCVAFGIAGLISALLLVGCGPGATEQPIRLVTDCEWDFLPMHQYTLALVRDALERDYPEFAPGSGIGAEWPPDALEPDSGGSWTNESWTIIRSGDRVTANNKTTGFFWQGVIRWKQVCKQYCTTPCWSEPDKAVTTSACIAPVPGQTVQPAGATPMPTCTPVPNPTATSTATATPTPSATPSPVPPTPAQADLDELHLGWVWPEGELEAQDRLAIDAQGTVYINDRNGRLHALRPPGEELWTFEEGEEGMAPPVLGPDGQTLYVLSLMPDTLWVLGTDGTRRLEVDLRHEPIALPLVSPDGAVYVRTMGGGYRYPPGEQEPVEFEWSDYFGPESAAFDAEGRLYTRDWDEVWVYSPQGEREQTCPIEDLSGSLAGWPGGGFVYTTSTGDLVAADPECQELWRYAGGEAETYAGWEPIAVAPDGSVFAARESGEIVALDQAGKLLWKQEPDDAFGQAIHLLPGAGGSLYAVSSSGQVAAFDELGERLWSYSLPGAGEPGPPQLTPGGGLAIAQGGRLWAFTTDPALLAAEPTPVPLPQSREAAEEEIVSFLLDGIGCNVESIFIWAPMGEDGASAESDKPIRVWWCWGGTFTEREDMQAAIDEADKRNAEAGFEVESYPVATFDFSIDVADDLTSATVYVGWTRGPLWGEGNLYTLRRSATGEWWVVDSEQVWIS